MDRAILEKTVQNIQEENNRLRAQLEALVSAAHHQQSAPSLTVQTNPRHDEADTSGGMGTAGLHDLNNVENLVSAARAEDHATPLDASLETQQAQHQQMDTSTTFTGPKPLDLALGFGVDGMDMQLLDGLRRQVTDARRQVAELEARIAIKRGPPSDPAHPLVVVPAAAAAAAGEAKLRTHALVEEKSALVCLIESLKRERDEMELEREVLEREVSARRVLLAGMEEGNVDADAGEGAGADEQGAAEGGQTPARSTGVGGKGKNGGEAGRDVGVERALMEVRSWLDSALTGWRRVCIPSIHRLALPLTTSTVSFR